MDKKYIELFKNLAQATAVTAEQVMDYDHSKNDEKGYDTAKIMRDDYQALTDSIDSLSEKYQPTKSDIAKLLVAAMVQTNQLQNRIDALKKAMTGYQTDVIPKLQEVLDKAENDNDAVRLAEEKFIIEDNK